MVGKRKGKTERTGLMSFGKDDCGEDHSVSPKTLTLKMRRLVQIENKIKS